MENSKFSPEAIVLETNIQEFYDKYDLSLPEKEKDNDSYINNLIQQRLSKYSDKWFAEYSAIATTIDPQRENKLRCFSFINGNESFKDKIEKYVSPIIDVLIKNAGDENWWFNNPETFLAPSHIEPYISFTNHNFSVDPDLVQEINDIAEAKVKKYQGTSPLYYSTMDYPRSFQDILNFSKIIYNKKKNEDESNYVSALVEHYHKGVEEARLYYDAFIAGENETYCYLTFPIIASHARFITPDIYGNTFGEGFLQNRFQGLGHCFIYFNIKDTENFDIKDFKEQIILLFDDINRALHNLAFNYTFNIGVFLQRKFKEEAKRSAKAAIMSRNMSHNLGSHVMAYLKQHLSSVTSIINDNVLAEMIVPNANVPTATSDTPLPFLVGMGHFISYLQERQDFIATIATDYIPYFATVNFKDFIYDELNPDKRFARHRDRKNLQPDNILLGNIARSEGLGRKTQTTANNAALSDIILNFCDSRGNIFDGAPVVNESNTVISGRKQAQQSLEEMRDINVSLPGGVVGRQAVFSIVENIIRNAAKHGNWRSEGRLELTFAFFDKDSIDEEQISKIQAIRQKQRSLQEVGKDLSQDEKSELSELTSDAPEGHLSLAEILWLFYSESSDSSDLYFVTVTDNIPTSQKSVERLRMALREDYIDEHTITMKEGNKGIKELRISAAWLRGAKDECEYYVPHSEEKIDKPQHFKKAPLMYARLNRQKEGKETLQYIFCLQKPRTVAVVTQETLTEEAQKAIRAIDWRCYTPEAYKLEANKSFNFTICENERVFKEIRPYSSSRVTLLESTEKWDEIRNGISKEEGIEIERILYQNFIDKKETIWIDDQKSKAIVEKLSSEEPGYARLANNYYQISDVDIRVIDGCKEQTMFTYRKHHDTLDEFKKFMSVNSGGCQFVESITGDTSTDRLIRNEKYDFRWYYSHLHAMKQKVAIFDERLFSRIMGIEESNFTKGRSLDLAALKAKYSEMEPMFQDEINECETIEALNAFAKENDLQLEDTSVTEVFTKDYLAMTYFQKGISLFTLIKETEPDSNSFGLYGLFVNKHDDGVDMPAFNQEYQCKCGKLASIKWENDTLTVKNTSDTPLNFDFISIHQGLLDKLYESFDIKYDGEKKIKFTTQFWRHFKKGATEVCAEWDNGFVPGMIVHSGRSKPAENDMPQQLPFIQYASIEHAVLDCKYSLIDLLENARYEQ